MTLSVIKQSLHNYLEIADEKKLKAIYTIVEDEIKSASLAYSEELKNELDKRQHDYKTGKTKVITAKESKNRIEKLLKSKMK
ncbi:MAG: hypothetical protein U0U67_04010 [Chitinophagales bacterium]